MTKSEYTSDISHSLDDTQSEPNRLLPSIGQRYRLRYEVDCSPFFVAQPGLVGTVTHSDEHLIRLQMDDENSIEWDDFSLFCLPIAEAFSLDCELLSD